MLMTMFRDISAITYEIHECAVLDNFYIFYDYSSSAAFALH